MRLGYTEFSFEYAFTENLIRAANAAPQGAPVLNRAAHLADQFLRYVNRKPPSVVAAVENVAAMLLAGQTRLAVRLHAPTAAKAQRTKKCWPQTGRIALHPAKDVNRQFGVDANHP